MGREAVKRGLTKIFSPTQDRPDLESPKMFDHVSLVVRDFNASRAFYDAALAPLGAGVRFEGADPEGHPFAGYGRDRPMFWLNARGEVSGPVHIAFAAASRAEVDAFHRAALAAGGQDNGPPGPRPEYGPNYYGAFVLDPDGLNVEAVFKGAA
jgi:catechol 2,3-dioxygenase-like lactoylglutathione lyase family enzyme